MCPHVSTPRPPLCHVQAQLPSQGDALVCGLSVRDPPSLDRVRALTGICPQFDVLWGPLTGREHLLLLADVRGLPWHLRQPEAERLLKQVMVVVWLNMSCHVYLRGIGPLCQRWSARRIEGWQETSG